MNGLKTETTIVSAEDAVLEALILGGTNHATTKTDTIARPEIRAQEERIRIEADDAGTRRTNWTIKKETTSGGIDGDDQGHLRPKTSPWIGETVEDVVIKTLKTTRTRIRGTNRW